MAPVPHYLRFARAVALVSVAASAPGCYASHQRGEERPDAARADASPQPDAAVLPDAGDPCLTCTCYRNGDPNSCEAHGFWQCCATLGPLPPPELAA